MTPHTRARIIDANLNRLAEGLRVVEDVCRFGLVDVAAAGRLKKMRRAVAALRRVFPADLTSARDSGEDPGRARIVEPARRADLLEIVGASFGRVQESLRVLEEMGKLGSAAAARAAKEMRYETYELERRVLPALDRGGKVKRLRGLYLILSEPAVGYERLAEIAVRERVAAIQLREKGMRDGELLALARRLREITRVGNERRDRGESGGRGTRVGRGGGEQSEGTLFFVNDRPDIARLAEADGVHLGQGDLGVAEARAIGGDRLLVGVSSHNARELRAALRQKPDYVAIGPVYGTRSKKNPEPTLGIEKARRLLEGAGEVPAVAIGGIDEGKAREVIAAGFAAFAVIGAVGEAAEPGGAIRGLNRAAGGKKRG